jgi:hypothetical protein
MYPAVKSTARAMWKVARIPVIAAILLCAPTICVLCGAMAVGGMIAALLFEVSAVGPTFPFFHTISMSSLVGMVAWLCSALASRVLRDP